MAKEKVITTKALRINTNLYQADEEVTKKDLKKLPTESKKQLFDEGKLVSKEVEDDRPVEITKSSLMSENKDVTIGLVKEAGLPEDEWKELNKEPLVDYYLASLEASDEEDEDSEDEEPEKEKEDKESE